MRRVTLQEEHAKEGHFFIDLCRRAIAGLMAKSRADTEAPSDMNRFERERLQNTAKGEMTRKEKILIYSIVAGLVVLAVGLWIKKSKGGHAVCDTHSTQSHCLWAYLHNQTRQH